MKGSGETYVHSFKFDVTRYSFLSLELTDTSTVKCQVIVFCILIKGLKQKYLSEYTTEGQITVLLQLYLAS